MLVTAINVGEQGDILLFTFYFNVEEVCWDNVKVLCVEFDKPFKVFGADAVVAELEIISVYIYDSGIYKHEKWLT